MALDQYSLCPGGTGKKIKFCCPEMLDDLVAIDKLLEKQQFRACLETLERLEKDHPGKECVYAIKTLVLRIMEQWDEASQVANAFYEAHPTNAVALSEKAIHLIRTTGARSAMTLAQQALASEQLSASLPRIFTMLQYLGMGLWVQHEYLATQAIYTVLLALRPEDPELQATYAKLLQLPGVPAWVKEVRLVKSLQNRADDAPEMTAFRDAFELATKVQWVAAAAACEKLAKESQLAAAWYNLAVLRAWLTQTDAAVEALHQYADLSRVADSGVSNDDAGEAEALALFFRETPLGDEIPMLAWTHDLRDANAVDEALVKSKRLGVIRIDWSQFRTEGNPAPRAGYMIWEHEVPESVPEGVEISTLAARVLGRVLVFGRETDRPARIEVMEVLSPDRTAVMQLLAEELGGLLEAATHEDEVDRVSLAMQILQQGYRLPQNSDPEQVAPCLKAMTEKRFHEEWLNHPLGTLDGMTPLAAATKPESQNRLAAILLWIEAFVKDANSELDLQAIRTELHLPIPQSIDPTTLTGPFAELPIMRLARVELAKLGDGELLEALQRLVSVQLMSEVTRYAKEIVSRPSMASQEGTLLAYDQLVRTTEDPTEAAGYLERGRALATHLGRSCGPWDLMELGLRFRTQDANGIMQLVQHIQRHHGREPQIMMALQQILVEAGLIRPDGRPAQMPQAESASGLIMPDGSAPESTERGGLWTPDGVIPTKPAASPATDTTPTPPTDAGGEKKSGLWIPD